MHEEIANDASKNRFKCDICAKEFNYKGNLKQHRETHDTIPKGYTCDICHKVITRRWCLKEHKKRMHEKLHTCDICQQQFTLLDLKQHKEAVHSKNKCDICPKEFVLKGNMKQHRRTHSENRLKYSCDTCEREYLDKRALRKHKKYEHGNIDKTVNCNVCMKELCKSGLKNHMALHDESRKMYKCDICENEFTTTYYLKQHMSLHDESDEKVSCEGLGSVAERLELKAHVREVVGSNLSAARLYPR